MRLDPFVPQVLARLLAPEAERVADVPEVGEHRVLGRLAALFHQHVDDTVAVLDEPGPQVAQHGGPPFETERLPARLRGAGAIYERRHLRGVEGVDVADDLARRGVLDGDAVLGGSGGAVGLDGDFGVLECGHQMASCATSPGKAPESTPDSLPPPRHIRGGRRWRTLRVRYGGEAAQRFSE